jgi:small subunit ribosomal protein S16
MSVRIRLTRVGATGQPSYRVVATDRRRARDGRSLETLGHYNPRTEPMTLVLDLPKVDAWIAKGAQPSEVVGKLIAKARAGGTSAGGKTGPKAAEKGYTAPGTRPVVEEPTVVVEAAPEAPTELAAEAAAEVATEEAAAAVADATPAPVAEASAEDSAAVAAEAPVAESPVAETPTTEAPAEEA